MERNRKTYMIPQTHIIKTSPIHTLLSASNDSEGRFKKSDKSAEVWLSKQHNSVWDDYDEQE